MYETQHVIEHILGCINFLKVPFHCGFSMGNFFCYRWCNCQVISFWFSKLHVSEGVFNVVTNSILRNLLDIGIKFSSNWNGNFILVAIRNAADEKSVFEKSSRWYKDSMRSEYPLFLKNGQPSSFNVKQICLPTMGLITTPKSNYNPKVIKSELYLSIIFKFNLAEWRMHLLKLVRILRVFLEVLAPCCFPWMALLGIYFV